MNIPSRRKLAAATLVIAGLGAFLVPFLLHGPNTQGTSSNNTNNGNPGGTSTTPGTTPRSGSGTGNSGGESGEGSESNGQNGSTGTCSGNEPGAPAHSQVHGKNGSHGKHKGLAKNLEVSAQHMLGKIAKHSPAFHERDTTRTDNDVDGNNGHHNGPSGNQDSSCTSDTEDEDD